MTYEEIVAKYTDRIKKLLANTADLIRELPGRTCGEIVVDEYEQTSLYFAVYRQGYESIEVRFTVCDSEEYDRFKGGLNFSLEATTFEGEYIAGFTPYNYQCNCWVPMSDDEAVEERFNLMMQADLGELVYEIGEH